MVVHILFAIYQIKLSIKKGGIKPPLFAKSKTR